MNLKSIILGSHCYFAREGDEIDEITVGPESKPDNDPVSNWTSLGIVGDFTVDPQMSEIIIKRPAPGQMVDADVIETNRQGIYGLMLKQASELAWELLFGAKPINQAAETNPGAYAPLSRTTAVKGWFKFQQYDQNNTLINVTDVWAHVKIDGAVTFAEAQTEEIRFQFRLRQLYSSLNSGVLSNL